MKSLLSLLLASLLAGAQLAAHAQIPILPPTAPAASTYAVEYDSLQQRTARVRTRIEKGIVRFKNHYAGLAGTSRRTRSFASPLLLVLPMTGLPGTKSVLVKRQIVKHKTRNAQIEKVFYYGAGKRLLLYEYYEEKQLVHQRLIEYATRNGREYAAAFRTTEWVRGDYLRVTLQLRPEQLHSTQLRYYFTAPRPHPIN